MGFSPTGKGKVEEKLVGPPLSGVTGIQALLFNFDTNGTAVKDEHKAWLDTRAVPILTADRSRTIQMTGTASKVGTNAANLIVSEKRVKAVRDHLLQKGVLAEQIDFTFTGEELSTSKLQNDERDRAVAVLVVTGSAPRTAPVVFERKDNGPGANRNDGFDEADGVRTAWVMVPFGTAFKEVRVRNGNGARLVSTNRGVARVVNPDRPGFEVLRLGSDNEVIGIKPEGLGTARIRVLDGNQELGRLDVSVKRSLQIVTAFHFVQSTSSVPGRQTISTERRPDNLDPRHSNGINNLDDLLRKMNEIFVPQANIRFTPSRVLSRNLTMPDLGTEVRVSSTAAVDEWLRVVFGPPDNRDASANFNVFFVREVDRDAEGTTEVDPSDPAGVRRRFTDTTEASAGRIASDARRFRSCLVEDQMGTNMAVIMSHEAGHTLDTGIDRDPAGAVHEESNRALLMFEAPGNRSRKINRFWADRFNPD